MVRKPPVDDPTYDGLVVETPQTSAAGPSAVTNAMVSALRDLGPVRTLKLLSKINQKDGFDCMSCAWPDPGHRSPAEFCENGARAVAWEATPLTVPTTFWAEHPVSELQDRSEYWLGQQGRLVEPVHKAAGSDHYVPVTWDEAFRIVADRLRGLDSPDQAAFYTSGRASNEAAFVYQLFVRAFGTNNLPDCSNMCHESTGTALNATIGIGKSTVSYDDFAQADLVVVMGQNPGTNHPRMLTALEAAKRRGAAIVAVNPLPEVALKRYKNPQTVRGIAGRGTEMADQFLQIRSGGDMALLQWLSKRVLEAEDRAPGTVLDHAFLDEHTLGLDDFRDHVRNLDEREVALATGLAIDEIDRLAERYLAADRVIITWAMGLTQHRKGVDTIKEIVNLLLLRGNIGKPGAGASPIRGHSNVQGDRTMGIWEKMPDAFLDALAAEFSFDPPRTHGVDSVRCIEAMGRGEIKVWFALGGNLVGAISDTRAAEAAMRGTDLTVQVSTKLNRSHVVTGAEALILPTLGRTDVDLQESGPQFVTVEDSVCAVHATHGALLPASPELLSEVSIVTRLARAVLGDDNPVDWAGFERDYDTIRDSISRVVPGFEDFNARARRPGGFVLPNGPRDSRTFPTPTGRAMITVNELLHVECPEGRLILQTVRSHDQFNTTMYGLNDRYRGIRGGRDVVFVHPDDLAELGLADGDRVDIVSEWKDEPDRVLPYYRVVAFPTARGCAATYFPEANVLVPLASTALGSNTPVSKAIVVRLEPVSRAAHDGRVTP
ncbi:formate dehydrogenase subunit alpha [Cellulomonas chitinilytica]|uniref:Formate dehydrogenase subunit alpha n=1 Tax=Cellulomonas chitinilytica TaxID=398759 RepID=A0A919P1M9_9CELL|nr:FdhF/YdeP family oxidoreductase [Cellulomonas chitinilytica]GIG20011.1 formate dehydrogenase subunit alpha [Cellulomonas chitinilytica]